MTEKRANFLKDVRHEIEMLREHTTEAEKSKLDFHLFNPHFKSKCIYGQLTGSCESVRAKELMDKCCIKVMNLKESYFLAYSPSVDDERFVINGKYDGQTWGNYFDGLFIRSYSYMSALEAYIFTDNCDAKDVMDYIKGEIDNLELQ